MSELTRKDAEEITKVFLQDYPVARQYLTFIFRKTSLELFSYHADELPPKTAGGYLSKDIYDGHQLYRGRVYVVLENVKDRADFLATLRHEVLGHYGINSFSLTEKSALLHSIIRSRNEPSIEQFWETVEKHYSDKSIDVQAEEVFARVFEHIQTRPCQLATFSDYGVTAFHETCVSQERPILWKDLLYIASMVAHGLHDGSRTQQHFPQDDALVLAGRIQSILSRTITTDISLTFYDAAETVIRQALDSPTMDWREVENETIRKHAQKPEAVLQFLLENSPGAVTIEEQLALRRRVGELAPVPEAQFAKEQSNSNDSEFVP